MKKLVISFLLIFCVCVNFYFAEAKTVEKIKLTVNNKDLIVDLEDNTSTKALVDKLTLGSIKIEAKDYGTFEKVGKLGFTLPTDNKEITTEAGDLILFDGDQISLYYDTNIWSLTKLGKVEDISKEELKNLLGSGNVTMTLSLLDENIEEVNNVINNTNTLNVVSNNETIVNNVSNTENAIITTTTNTASLNTSNVSNTSQIKVVNNQDTTTSNVSLPNVGENISHILGILILVFIIYLVIKYNKRG